MSYLPSKNFIIIILSAIVIGTGVFFLLNFLKKETTFTQESTNAPYASLGGAANGQSAFGNLAQENNEPNGIGGYGTGNLTESLSEDLLASLMLQGGEEMSEADVSSIISTLFKKTATLETPLVYGTGNVNTIKNTPDAFKTYGNAVMTTIRKHASANAADTLNTFEHLLKARDENAVSVLRRIAEEYGKLESDILSIPVPLKTAPLHIDFVNEVRAIGSAVTDMGFALKDPLRGTLGLSAYLKRLDRAWGILNRTNILLQAEGIKFAENESGSAWNNF